MGLCPTNRATAPLDRANPVAFAKPGSNELREITEGFNAVLFLRSGCQFVPALMSPLAVGTEPGEQGQLSGSVPRLPSGPEEDAVLCPPTALAVCTSWRRLCTAPEFVLT